MESIQDRSTALLQPKPSQTNPLFGHNETQKQQNPTQPVPQTQQQQPRSEHFTFSITPHKPESHPPMIFDTEADADVDFLRDHPNQWHAQNRIFGRYQTERTVFPFVHARVVERAQVLLEREEARERERAVGELALKIGEGD